MSPQKQRILTLAFCVYAVSTLISMAIMSVGAGLLLIALLWSAGGPKAFFSRLAQGIRASAVERRYLWVCVALAVVCVMSLLGGVFHPLAYGGRFSQVHLLRDSLKLWYLPWPLLMVVGLRALSDEGRKKALKCWIIAFGALSCLGIVQHYIGWPRPQPIPSGFPPVRYHATLFLGHHLSVASILIFPFFACLDFLRVSFESKKQPIWGWSRWTWMLLAVLGCVVLVFTYSRTLEVALPLTILLWVFLSFPWRRAAVFAVALLIVAGFVSQMPLVHSRFSGWSFFFSVNSREDLWKANLAFWEQRPLLGVGWKHNQELSGYFLMQKYPGASVFSGNAHNNIMDMMGGTGILGTLAWLAWSLFVLWLPWEAWRRWRRGGSSWGSPGVFFASGLLCAWVTFQINGLTQVNFWDAKVTHQMMWMVAWSFFWLAPQQPSETHKAR